jgi:hypothetical protein
MMGTGTDSSDDTRKSLAQLLTPEHQAHATLATLVSFLGLKNIVPPIIQQSGSGRQATENRVVYHFELATELL